MPPIDTSVWGTDTGLLDDFEFVIKDQWFGPNPESDYPDVFYLHLMGAAFVDGELADDEYRIRFSTGKDWEIEKGGAKVTSAKGALKFHGSSGCGEFVNRAIEIMGRNPQSDSDAALEKVLSGRGAPTDAATWAGLAFRMELIEKSFRDRETQEERNYYRQLPTEFLPERAEALLDAGGGKSTPTKGAKETTITKRALNKAVIAFAKDFDDDEFDDFVEAVFDPDEFDHADAITEELKAAILDEDDIWASAQG